MLGLNCWPAISARVSNGPVGEPEERNIADGGGKMIGDCEDRSWEARVGWFRRGLTEGAVPGVDWFGGYGSLLLLTSSLGDAKG